jgi:hypothetical protein
MKFHSDIENVIGDNYMESPIEGTMQESLREDEEDKVNRWETSSKKQHELMELVIKEIFSTSYKLVFNDYGFGVNEIEIKDIQWDEDLLTILKRLKFKFDVDIKDHMCDCGEKEYAHSTLDLQLTVKGE